MTSSITHRFGVRLNQLVNEPALLRTVTIVILAIGIIARVRQWFVGRSLWIDEAMLALNIINRTPAELLRQLDYDQGAPVLFLQLEKLATQIGGSGELALRFVPLLSGLAALVLFALLAWRILSPFAAALAMLFLAFSRQFLWYSNEIKQYAGDVLASVISLWMFTLLRTGRPGLRRWIVAIVLGMLLIFFSHSSIMVLGSVALIGFVEAWSTGRREQRVGFLIAGVAWFVVFLFNYINFISGLLQSDYLNSYWSTDGYMPPLSQGMDVLIWMGDRVRSLFFDTLGIGLDALAMFAGLAGLIVLWRRDWALALVVLLPPVVSFIAAMLQTYPFDGRLILFLAPLTAIVVGAGTEGIVESLRPRMPLLGWMLVLLLVGQPILAAGYNVLLPRYREEFAPVLERVAAARQPGDTLYVRYDAKPAFEYYAPRFGIEVDQAVIGERQDGDWQVYYDDIDRLAAGSGRVWLLFSRINGVDGLLGSSTTTVDTIYLAYLDDQGLQPIEEIREFGAVAYLFDFGQGG